MREYSVLFYWNISHITERNSSEEFEERASAYALRASADEDQA